MLTRRIREYPDLNHELEIQQAIRDLYGKEGIFDEHAIQHFDKFIGKMDEYVEKTIKYPYSKYNIIQTLCNFDEGFKKEYLMGPFE